jgi:hypothetical protein
MVELALHRRVGAEQVGPDSGTAASMMAGTRISLRLPLSAFSMACLVVSFAVM